MVFLRDLTEARMSEHSNAILVGAGIPTSLLISGSLVLFARRRSFSSFLQVFGVFGAGGLMLVVLTHAAETFHLFPFMQWGLEDSLGHYLDFGSAVLGLTLFPVGYFLHAMKMRPAAR
jgi:hypothetical protein